MAFISEIRQVIRYWWIFPTSGTLLILFGAIVFAYSAAAYAGLTIYFEIAFVVNGVLEIVFALSNFRSMHGWGWHMAGGIFDLLVGVLLVSNPILAAVSLPFFAGFWLLFRSVSIIGRVFDLTTMPWSERSLLLVLGAAGLIFSFMILYNPVLGALTLITWTALALFTIGVFYIYLGLHLRKLREEERKNIRVD